MLPTENDLDKNLKARLDLLQNAAPLDPQAVAAERKKYLAQAENFRIAISRPAGRGRKGFFSSLALAFTFQKKEHNPMLNTLMAIILAISVLFGSGAVTVYAAQSSLPQETLYPVKTWSEDLRLSLAPSPQQQLDLMLEFTGRRVDEIAELHASAQPASEGAAVRLQEQLETVLQIAAGLDDPQMVQALAQIRTQAQTQAQTMTTLMAGSTDQERPVLARTQQRLQEQVRLAAAGEADPQAFRLQVREQQHNRQNMPVETGQPQGPRATGRPAEGTPASPGNPSGPGQGGSGSSPTGAPGSHFGPGGSGPQQTPLATGESYGPGPGSGEAPSEPGGYGPGPQAGTAVSTPQQSGGGNGPGPGQPQATPNPDAGSPGSGGGGQGPGGGGSGGGQSTQSPGQGGRP